MRKNFIAASVVFLSVVGICPSRADVLLTDSIDYGPCSVILDWDHNKEFLPLGFTGPYSYNEVTAELAAGGFFEGWRVATVPDLDLLAASANVVNFSADPEIIARAVAIRDWFGFGRYTGTGGTTRGLTKNVTYAYNGALAQTAYHIGTQIDIYSTPQEEEAFFHASGYGGADNPGENIYLVREKYPDGKSFSDYHVNGLTYSGNFICASMCIPTTSRESGKKCSDFIDNDCDGLVDAVDPDCGGTNEPAPDSGGIEGKGKTCTDGLDNDGNGLIDCADPGCSSSRVCK